MRSRTCTLWYCFLYTGPLFSSLREDEYLSQSPYLPMVLQKRGFWNHGYVPYGTRTRHLPLGLESSALTFGQPLKHSAVLYKNVETQMADYSWTKFEKMLAQSKCITLNWQTCDSFGTFCIIVTINIYTFEYPKALGDIQYISCQTFKMFQKWQINIY